MSCSFQSLKCAFRVGYKSSSFFIISLHNDLPLKYMHVSHFLFCLFTLPFFLAKYLPHFPATPGGKVSFDDRAMILCSVGPTFKFMPLHHLFLPSLGSIWVGSPIRFTCFSPKILIYGYHIPYPIQLRLETTYAVGFPFVVLSYGASKLHFWLPMKPFFIPTFPFQKPCHCQVSDHSCFLDYKTRVNFWLSKPSLVYSSFLM